MEDSKSKELSISKLADLEVEIVRFDVVLDSIQKHFPDDTLVGDFIANARDALFGLRQALHGLNIIDFTSAFEKPCWWVEELIEEPSNGEEVS